jgi:[ribosomal protein S5]-alanine N-acetyltransferase
MTLQTQRLTLRPWSQTDLADLIEGLNDLAVSRWLAFVPHPYTQADAQRWIDHCLQTASPDAHHFAIELKSERKVIGGVTLDRISPLHGTAGGGIWIATRYQGHGYGTEAFGEKIRFAFEDLKLRRLENGFFPGNPASLKMQEKFGYQIEGHRRQAYLCQADGQLKDETLTALLREDWIKPTHP